MINTTPWWPTSVFLRLSMASAASQDIQRAIMKHEGRYVGWRQNVDGEPATQLEASDVYSLGITIWEASSSVLHFRGTCV